jgi:hypothetical protein
VGQVPEPLQEVKSQTTSDELSLFLSKVSTRFYEEEGVEAMEANVDGKARRADNSVRVHTSRTSYC